MPEKNVALAIKKEQVIKMCNDDLMDMFVLRQCPRAGFRSWALSRCFRGCFADLRLKSRCSLQVVLLSSI